MLVQRAPSRPLAEYVQTLWYSRTQAHTHTRELALPSGAITLTINLSADPIRIYRGNGKQDALTFHESAVWGPQIRAVTRDTSCARTVVGIQFRPGMAGAVLGLNALDLSNEFVSPEDLWGSRARLLRQTVGEESGPGAMLQRVEMSLIERLKFSAIPSQIIRHAIGELARADAASVSQIERRSGCSTRRFIELFTAAVGMTPVRFKRLMRLQRVLRDAAADGGRPDWARIAADTGFVDQAHLSHDFKAFSGITPGRYRPVSAERIHHIAFHE